MPIYFPSHCNVCIISNSKKMLLLLYLLYKNVEQTLQRDNLSLSWLACFWNFLKFQFQKIFFFICKITSQTRKHFSENQFQNSEVCSIEEIESHLISKPERFFLNHNFSVHGALYANQTSSRASCLMSGWLSVKNPSSLPLTMNESLETSTPTL